jgi:hypothetical protein
MSDGPIVVAALQSPTLLNILHQSTAWQFWVTDLYDTDQLAELRWLQASTYAGNPRDVNYVLVCTPNQWGRAGNLFPRAERVWMLHNGNENLTPPHGDRCALTFSRRVGELHRARRPQMRIATVTPAYQVEPIWQEWAPRIWTLLNRPTTARSEYIGLIEELVRGLPFEWYGQGHANGILEGSARTDLERACAAYVTPLPTWAGFGLAQHECLARGVPLVGTRWGDLSEELPAAYTALDDDPAARRRALERLLDPGEGPAYARELSELGMAMIREHRTVEQMDASIRNALNHWT